MCDLMLDAELQAMLDRARDKREAREAQFPARRTIPHAAGKPIDYPDSERTP